LAVHAFEYLEQTPTLAPVVVVFGDEPFLKRLVLKRLRARVLPDDAIPFAEFDGTQAEWRDVFDELCTVSLFNAAGTRLAVVAQADDFVRDHRARLEQYVEQPERRAVLVLDVNTWPSNTRLYKLVEQHGLPVECRAPQTGEGKQKNLDARRVADWCVRWARDHHKTQLARNAAALLLELTGPEFGLLDQEIAKLALFAGPDGAISEQIVRDVVGGWRAKTAWELVDAVASGDSAEALAQLDRLLLAGEHPNALLGPISWSLRRFAAATRAFQRAERHRQRMALPEALEKAGFFKWPPDAMRKAEANLKQMGRRRAALLYRWLLETDLALKGSHSSPEMARFALERLFVQLDRRLAAPRTP